MLESHSLRMNTYSPILEERFGWDTSLSVRPTTLKKNEHCPDVKHPIRLGTRGATHVPITPFSKTQLGSREIGPIPWNCQEFRLWKLRRTAGLSVLPRGQWEELGTSADTEEWPDPVRPHLGYGAGRARSAAAMKKERSQLRVSEEAGRASSLPEKALRVKVRKGCQHLVLYIFANPKRLQARGHRIQPALTSRTLAGSERFQPKIRA